ncbi:MAG TPA: response regulator transcription factor [Solirubrobacteraceae bacterium]|nr:response regulator transcription factor [Solirubrobacteraceae bacterium]
MARTANDPDGCVTSAGAVVSAGPSGSSRTLRVLIVDDHEVVQWGFRLMLGSQPWVARCIGAPDREQACELAVRYRPHVAVVDLCVGRESGIEICEHLAERSPETNVLLISGARRITSEAALAAGALGFISKDCGAADVARAVRMVGLGMSVFQEPRPLEAHLSAREGEVLALIARGCTNREIAAALHLSAHTVKGHTSSLYRKLEAKNRAEAVQRAQRLGLAT